MQTRTQRQSEKVHTTCGDILAHLTGGNVDACSGKIREEFRLQQVDLAEVHRLWVFADAVAVSDLDSGMGVAFYTQAGKDRDLFYDWLAETMGSAASHGNYDGGHEFRISFQALEC